MEMRETIRELAQEIAQDLVGDMKKPTDAVGFEPPTMVDLLVNKLAKEVTVHLSGSTPANVPSYRELKARLRKMESKLERLSGSGAGEDDDEASGTGDRFPNLKYAKPKYQNVESLLNYVERDDDKGGLKLVIMNFND